MVRAFPDAELEEASKPHRRELQALFAEYARDPRHRLRPTEPLIPH
jgi:hypothetical protein